MELVQSIHSFNNDIVIRLASYLHSKDILNLSSTCKTFGSIFNHDGGNTAARQIISFASKEERDAIPKLADQSYIELYSELEQLRAPRTFGQLVGPNLSYVNDDKSHIKLMGNKINENTAISNHVMRAGKHYVTFRKRGIGTGVSVGLIRPVKDFDKRRFKSFGFESPKYFGILGRERTERWGGDNGRGDVYVCLLRLESGKCAWGGCRFFSLGNDYSWNGQESFVQEGFGFGDDNIGMLLDLDAGTLTVYKNGQRLGVMKDKLSGEFSWVASMKIPGTTICIKKGPTPAD